MWSWNDFVDECVVPALASTFIEEFDWDTKRCAHHFVHALPYFRKQAGMKARAF